MIGASDFFSWIVRLLKFVFSTETQLGIVVLHSTRVNVKIIIVLTGGVSKTKHDAGGKELASCHVPQTLPCSFYIGSRDTTNTGWGEKKCIRFIMTILICVS